jgi:hypothetical protein
MLANNVYKPRGISWQVKKNLESLRRLEAPPIVQLPDHIELAHSLHIERIRDILSQIEP